MDSLNAHLLVEFGTKEDIIKELLYLQAKIDQLMLEYCPDEMTQEQLAEWARHQKPLDDKRTREIEEALRG